MASAPPPSSSRMRRRLLRRPNQRCPRWSLRCCRLRRPWSSLLRRRRAWSLNPRTTEPSSPQPSSPQLRPPLLHRALFFLSLLRHRPVVTSLGALLWRGDDEELHHHPHHQEAGKE